MKNQRRFRNGAIAATGGIILAIVLWEHPYTPASLEDLTGDPWTHAGYGRTPYEGPPVLGLPRSFGTNYDLPISFGKLRDSVRANVLRDGFQIREDTPNHFRASRPTPHGNITVQVSKFDFRSNTLASVQEFRETQAYEFPQLWLIYGVRRIGESLSPRR